jgi:hypothetical protein
VLDGVLKFFVTESRIRFQIFQYLVFGRDGLTAFIQTFFCLSENTEWFGLSSYYNPLPGICLLCFENAISPINVGVLTVSKLYSLFTGRGLLARGILFLHVARDASC